jgi:RND family efflux transporter MFP subunit
MKNWKVYTGIILALAIIAFILVRNKQKMAMVTSGGINAANYVNVDKVVKQNLTSNLILTGVVNAYNDVALMSEAAGKITAVYVKVGDYKTAGSVLFQVDDELKKAALLSANANYENAKKDYQRYEDLYKQKAASDFQLDQAKLLLDNDEAQYIVAKRQLEDTKIKTPISGVVTARNVDVGSTVQGAPQATNVANVVDISRLKVKLNVAEKDVISLKAGDPVSVTSDVYPGITYKGKIETISVKGDEAHTYPVEFVVENQKGNQLKAGMFASVEFTSIKGGNSLVIPRAALVGSVKDAQVYVVENNIAKIRNISVGAEYGTFIIVSSGLNEGETVVVNGQNNLVNNAKVEILNK